MTIAPKALKELGELLAAHQPRLEVVNQPVLGLDKVLTTLANAIEFSIAPLVGVMDKKLEIDLSTHQKMQDLSQQLRDLEVELLSENGERKAEPKP